MSDEWTKEDSAAARLQGWDVFEIWDGRLTYEIQKHDASPNFQSDEHVRAFVQAHAGNNPLCHKAWATVFRSKVGAAA